MDINSAPDEILLNIIDCLPFKDQVRFGGVSQRFNELSRRTISKTKCLILNEDLISYAMSTNLFPDLLEDCSRNLLKIVAQATCNKGLLKILIEHQFPNLVHLEIILPFRIHDELDLYRKCYMDLIRRNKNIRSIIIRPGFELEFTTDLVFENLERLEIFGGYTTDFPYKLVRAFTTTAYSYDKVLKSLTGRLPNLKYLLFRNYNKEDHADSFNFTGSVFVDFLNSLENLKCFDFALRTRDFFRILAPMQNLWTLRSLTKLSLDTDNVSGGFVPNPSIGADHLWKMVTGCRNLEVFRCGRLLNTTRYMTIEVLGRLRKLRKLCLCNFEIDSIRFMQLLEYCPQLEILHFQNFENVSTTADFIDFATKIWEKAGVREITIRFGKCDPLMTMYDEIDATLALEEIKNNIDFSICIEQCGDECECRPGDG